MKWCECVSEFEKCYYNTLNTPRTFTRRYDNHPDTTLNDATNDDDTQETEKHFMIISLPPPVLQPSPSRRPPVLRDTMGEASEEGQRKEGEFRSIHRSIIFAVSRSCPTAATNGNELAGRGRTRTDAEGGERGELAAYSPARPPVRHLPRSFIVVLWGG